MYLSVLQPYAQVITLVLQTAMLILPARTLITTCSVLMCLLLCGCTKEKSELINGEWKLTGLTAEVPYDWNFDGQLETDLYSVFTPCQKENRIQLEEGGKGRAYGNCTDTGIDIQWFTNGVVNYLEIWDSYLAGKYEVIELDRKKLVMKKRVFLQTTYHTYTLTRQ